MLLSVGVPAAVARFCYSRLDSQNRPLKLVVTALRAVTTLALLLLALDATVIRWQSAGGRLFIFAHPSESRYAERLAQNDRLNDRFQVDPASGTLRPRVRGRL